jgi:signal transduction histidine kinase
MRRFTADAAHQLRTPLSVMRSRGEVALRRERDADEYRAALRDVTREAGRLGGVVEKLMMLARADAGEVAFRRERLFLDDVVEEALITLRSLARERDLTLEADALHEVPVEGDATLLEQLVVVLVDNAIQFSPPHGRVGIKVEDADGRARLQVTDEGPGIAPADRPLVFEPFYRGNPTRGREGGAGLGLSIARWIVEAHGGTISLDAGGHGVGTVATVLLPIGARPVVNRPPVGAPP